MKRPSPVSLMALILISLLAACADPTLPPPQASQFEVTYLAPGASSGKVPVDHQKYEAGASVTILDGTGLTKKQLVFSSWNTKESGKGTDYPPGTVLKMPKDDLRLYAQWSVIKYTVSFDPNGGTGSLAALKLEGGTTSPLPLNNFVRAGYSFAGWNTASDGSGQAYADGASLTMGTAAVILFAQWQANSNALSFAPNLGTGTMPPLTLLTGQTTNLPAVAFHRAGYHFTGWTSIENGTGAAWADQAPYTMGTAGQTLYAQWQADPQTLSFQSNGGVGNMAPLTLLTDAVINLPAVAFSRPGYAFSGWSSAPNGSGTSWADQGEYKMSPAPVVLYAQWTPATNTLSFNGNGGSGSMANLFVVTDGSATLPLVGFSRAGYTFVAWNTEANGSGRSYLDGDTFHMSIASVTLFAQWQAVVHTLHLNGNSGSGVMADLSLATDQTTTLPPQTFIKVGYHFTGWNTAADGSGQTSADQAALTMGTTDGTLYAQWAANLNRISFVANAGAGDMEALTVLTDAAVSLPVASFNRAGYAFIGWNTAFDGSGASYLDQAHFTMGPTDLTLFAQWQALPHVLNFQANGGTGNQASLTLLTDQVTSLPDSQLARPDYVFASWNTAADGSGADYLVGSSYTMGPNDASLYALWTPTVIFNANGGSGTMLPQAIAAGTSANLSAVTFTRSNYDFTGWTTAADGTGTVYADQAPLTIGSTPILLYARWSPSMKKIFFQGNGGSTGNPAVTVYSQDLAAFATGSLRLNNFTRTNFLFKEWNTSANGTGTKYADGANLTMGTTDVTLYAQWNKLLGNAIQGTALILTNTVTTVAGGSTVAGADGIGSAAQIVTPRGADTDGTYLYFAQTDVHTIRKMNLSTGAVTTIAGLYNALGNTDGMGSTARFNQPFAVCLAGNFLYVAESGNADIRRIDLTTNAVTTFISAAQGGFGYVWGLTTDQTYLYISDTGNNMIRKVALATGQMTTYPGGIPCYGLTTDGTYLYIATNGSNSIIRMNLATGANSVWLTGLAGPTGVSCDGTNLYIAERDSNRISKANLSIGQASWTVVAGNGNPGLLDGVGSAALFHGPRSLTTDGKALYVMDTDNGRIRKIR